MKKQFSTIVFIVLLFVEGMAQRPFMTVVPQVPVIAGEAFQVQYVVEDGTEASSFITPVFKGMQLVAGPNLYHGAANYANNFRQSTNYVFTLVATQPGKQLIPGAFILIRGTQVRSNDNFIEVITKEAAQRKMDKESGAGSDYFLRPGEDIARKVRQNLFVKVMVDKKVCYVGEPVVATFKLYSRLESRSDIVKNPGFYGFTVHDMVSLADREVVSEKVNGKLFDVHTIRKVQLYPLQPGAFMVDAMEIRNRVEFSKSRVNKKTEQEIVEGVLIDQSDEATGTGMEFYENEIRTEPIPIIVKPTPGNNKPASFDGAVGAFSMASLTPSSPVVQNKESYLEITIKGKGNFTQLNAPAIKWPPGLEGFEPVVNGSFDRTTSPLKGARVFRYAFVSARKGDYMIPAISFSYFNPDSGQYKTIATSPVKIKVMGKAGKFTINPENNLARDRKIPYNGLILALTLLVLFSLFLFYRKKKGLAEKQAAQVKQAREQKPSVESTFLDAAQYLKADDRSFYEYLHQRTWDFLAAFYQLRGSELNKKTVLAKINARAPGTQVTAEASRLLELCETATYTGVESVVARQQLLDDVKGLLKKISSDHSEYL